jgi:hypothetical protein
MQLTCPCCNARFPVESALQDDAARACVAAALALPPPLGDLLLRYLGLFRPQKRVLSWDRVRKLLADLTDSLADAQVSRNGVTRAAPVELWRMALEETLGARDSGALALPLKSHGYLCEIVWRKSGQIADAAERKREQQINARPHDRSAGQKHIHHLLAELRVAANGKPTAPEETDR